MTIFFCVLITYCVISLMAMMWDAITGAGVDESVFSYFFIPFYAIFGIVIWCLAIMAIFWKFVVIVLLGIIAWYVSMGGA